MSLGLVAAALWLAALAPPAAAQAPPVVAPGRDVLEGQIAPPRAAPARQVRIEGEIERSPCALSDPAYAAIKVTPTSFVLNNLGPVDAETMAPLYAKYIGTEQPISVICEVRDAVATRLRALGYVAAVQVPAQRIENGVVRLEVLYARVSSVRVLGDAGRNEGVFKRYLDRLTEAAVFNRFEAERWLLLARDVPGHEVRLILKPAGTGPGEMVAEISLVRTPVVVDFSVQNLAANQTGPWGGQLRAELNGLTGMGDRTTVSLYTTPDFSEQTILQLGHDFLVGGSGLRLGGRFTHAWTRPDVPALPPILSRTAITSFDASYPLIRRQAGSLNVAGGLDIVNQRVAFDGLPLSRDRLRIGWLRLDGEAIDMKGTGADGVTGWRLTGSLELRQGMDIFGASPDCSAAPLTCVAAGAVPPSSLASDPTAFLVRFQGRAELRPGRHLVLALIPRGQLSGAALPNFEQFAVGNFTVGRGYDPGTFIGDKGLGFAAEVAFPYQLQMAQKPVQLEPYVFGDAAWVWDRFSAPGVDPRRVGSVGGGLRAVVSNRARLDAVLAVPTETAGNRRAGDVRFLLTFTTRLLPWGDR